MSVRTLDLLQAFSPGADLWIVGNLDHSTWARKIDWYLHFQLLRAETHQAPQLSKELKTILEQWDFQAPHLQMDEKRDPLMVASRDFLPNKLTLQVPEQDKERAWIETCSELWRKLGRPATRIFVPGSYQIADSVFRQLFGDSNGQEREAEIEVVRESEVC